MLHLYYVAIDQRQPHAVYGCRLALWVERHITHQIKPRIAVRSVLARPPLPAGRFSQEKFTMKKKYVAFHLLPQIVAKNSAQLIDCAASPHSQPAANHQAHIAIKKIQPARLVVMSSPPIRRPGKSRGRRP